MNVTKLNHLNCGLFTLTLFGKQLESIEHLEVNSGSALNSDDYFKDQKNMKIRSTLKFFPKSFAGLKMICERNQTLKRIDCSFDPDMPPPKLTSKQQEYNEFLAIKPKETEIYLYGFNSVKTSLEFIDRFYSIMKCKLRPMCPGNCLIIDEQTLPILNQFDQDKLYELYKSIMSISIVNLPIDEAIYKKLTLVNDLRITLTIENLDNLQKFIDYWPDLICLKIYQRPEFVLSDYFLKLDWSAKYECIMDFKLLLFQLIDLSFLLKMKNLNYLNIILYYPVENDFILSLFKKLKHLAHLHVLFLKPKIGYSNEELSTIYI